MSNNFEAIIGLEIHAELKTKTKMFSPALNFFNKSPNTTVNEIDLGYPGALPSVNKKGVELAIIVCNILGMKIDNLLRFDRKNYFYSDNPKGYQITQNYYPIGKKGSIDIKVNNGFKTININRLHIEEDTAKQTHKGDATYIDYNRSGSPLIEIVTEPDIKSAYEAKTFIKKLREMLLYSGASDAKMEQGSLRCDVNISIRPIGSTKFGTKVEVKNINSITNVGKVIDYEIQRQEKLILLGHNIEQETRRFDDKNKITVFMRSKTDAVQYRYMSDANIKPIRLDHNWIKSIINNIPELPDQKRSRYLELGLDETKVEILIDNPILCDILDKTLQYTDYVNEVYNWISGPLLSFINTNSEHKVQPKSLAKMIEMLKTGEINSKQAKKIFDYMLKNSGDPEDIVKKLGLIQITDEKLLRNMVNEIIEEMNHMLNQYDTRPERVEKTFMGLLMQRTKGQAHPTIAMMIIKEEIKKRLFK